MADLQSVGRVALTIVGIAVVAVAAILIAKSMLRPAKEEVERKGSVLTGEYSPTVQECRMLEDSELPEELPHPKVDDVLRYVQVLVHYPGVAATPPASDHVLERVNGSGGAPLAPAWSEVVAGEGGADLYLIYKTTTDFEHARLSRKGTVLAERIDLQ